MPQQFQLELPLSTPADHHSSVWQSRQDRERILWTPCQRGRKWHVLTPEIVVQGLGLQAGKPDVYGTLNEFYRWRRVELLRGLNGFFIDIDAPGEKPEDRARAALYALEEQGVPWPNVVLYSARGPHLYWLFDQRISAWQLPRWQVTLKRLVGIVGGDPACVDATRVSRICGTTHSGTGQLVQGETFQERPYEFHELVREIMPAQAQPKRKAQVRDIRPRQEHIQVEGQGRTIYHWWHGVYRDLHTIMAHHFWMGGVGEGWRDKLLFLSAVSLSWFTRSEALEAEIMSLHRRYFGGLTQKEARAYTRPVVQRAIRAASGQTVEYLGQQRDPRYWFRKETLFDWLTDPETDRCLIEGLEDRMQGLVPDELVREKKRLHKEKVRRQAGAVERSVYEGTAAQRRETALVLRAEGRKNREIAETMGVSLDTVKGYFRKKV